MIFGVKAKTVFPSLNTAYVFPAIYFLKVKQEGRKLLGTIVPISGHPLVNRLEISQASKNSRTWEHVACFKAKARSW